MQKVTVFLMVFILVGCDHYANQMNSLAPAAGASDQYYGHSMTFTDHLAQEYMTLANIEQNERYDYQCAAHFVEKGKLAMEGQVVAPDNPRYTAIPQDQKDDLLAARQLLIEKIVNEGRPENRQTLAIAQTRYDCWVDQTKDWSHDQSKISCDDQFFEALTAVEVDYDFFGEELEFFI